MDNAGLFGIFGNSIAKTLDGQLAKFMLENADQNNNVSRLPSFHITPSVTITMIPPPPPPSSSASTANSLESASIATTSKPVEPPHIPHIPTPFRAFTVGNGVANGTALDLSNTARYGTLPTRHFIPAPLLNRTKSQPVELRAATARKPGIKRAVGQPQHPKSIRKSPNRRPSQCKASSSKDIPPAAEVTPRVSRRYRGSTTNKMSFPTIIRTPTGIRAATGICSFANDSNTRQMKPNPCNPRCQNHCHANWSESERMDMFQIFWSLRTVEERRDWVAVRIRPEDIAIKKTTYSNFRTCTFRYSLPHPKVLPGVTVCKNFLMATLDVSRSYVEKIAQDVKLATWHSPRRSKRDIPFQRRNPGMASNGKANNGKASNGKASNGKANNGNASNGMASNGKANNGKDSNGTGESMGQHDLDGNRAQVGFGWMTGKIEGPAKPEQPRDCVKVVGKVGEMEGNKMS